MNILKQLNLVLVFLVLLIQFPQIYGDGKLRTSAIAPGDHNALEDIVTNVQAKMAAIHNQTCTQLTQELQKDFSMKIHDLKKQFQHQEERVEEIQQRLELLKMMYDRMEALPENCESAMRNAGTDDGVYLLNISDSGLPAFQAKCQRIGNKIWTVIQRRQDGTVDFHRGWTDYKNGFGNLNGEFWLGLERIYQLIRRYPHELMIWLGNKDGEKRFAHYKRFDLGNEADKYELTADGHTGNVDDLLKFLNGAKFSTQGSDNDEKENGSCADLTRGAWWFKDCSTSHLNGPYNANDEQHYGIHWFSFGHKLTYSQMAIRRIN